VVAHAACVVALLAARTCANGRVPVPFAGHEHDWAAVDLGAWLAGNRGLPLLLLGTHADRTSGQRNAGRLAGEHLARSNAAWA
jgi:hypothetical protein